MKIQPTPKAIAAPTIKCTLDWDEMPESEKASGFEFVGPFIQRAYDARCVSDRTEAKFIAEQYEDFFGLEALRDIELMRARIARHLQYEGFRYAKKLDKLPHDFMVKYAESWKEKEKEKAMKPTKKSKKISTRKAGKVAKIAKPMQTKVK